MSQHDLPLAWNHALDVVPVGTLTFNVFVTRHETFILCECYSMLLPAMSLRRSVLREKKGKTGGGGLVCPEGESSIAMQQTLFS